jgi:hypothetical protein
MMPMRMPRKAPGVEKVEIPCRDATAQKILPAPFGPRPSQREGRSDAQGIADLAQPLPDMSHLGAEFYECCADPADPLLPFPKIRRDRAKLLAMQGDAS